LGLSLSQAAFGMFRVMNVNMASGIREITVQKGFDPRDFPLICAGGAGPIHAAMIAEELEIGRILVPRESSIFCAAGMLRSDLKHDYVRSYHTPFSAEGLDTGRFQAALRSMSDEANETLAGEGIGPEARHFDYALDLRYLGQYHEVRVDAPAAELEGPDLDAIAWRLHRTHNRLYGYDLEADGTAIELVNLRLSATGITEKPPIAREERVEPAADCARKGTRPVFLPSEGDFRDVTVYDGDKLRHGHRIEGPAIVEQVNTTVLLPDGYALGCDELGSFVMEKAT
jgi:N-methylhydantoinase A